MRERERERERLERWTERVPSSWLEKGHSNINYDRTNMNNETQVINSARNGERVPTDESGMIDETVVRILHEGDRDMNHTVYPFFFPSFHPHRA